MSTERPLNKAIDLVDDLIQAHHDYENASGRQTIPARDEYGALRSKVIALVDRAMREDAELLAALQSLETLFMRPGESSLEHFERVGEVFHRETGYLRPGKDSRTHDPEEREEAWGKWRDDRLARARAAIATATRTAAASPRTEP
jgi:hypothetical protein